jgi:MFS family permease
MFAAALSEAPARRFFAAHAQSCLGSGFAAVGLALLAYDRFDSAWAIAAVLVPDLLPAIVLGPLLGALIDRIGWRTCAVVADVLRSVAFLVILLSGSLEWMIVGAFVAGLGNALFGPSALAALPRSISICSCLRNAGSA